MIVLIGILVIFGMVGTIALLEINASRAKIIEIETKEYPILKVSQKCTDLCIFYNKNNEIRSVQLEPSYHKIQLGPTNTIKITARRRKTWFREKKWYPKYEVELTEETMNNREVKA